MPVEAVRLDSIQVLRGLAALSVAWFHMTNGYRHDTVAVSGSLGWLGVDCFFVISGFVIPYSLHVGGYGAGDFGRFLARRILRIEPPYLVSIVLVLALGFASAQAPGFAGPQPQFNAPQILSHLLYLIPLTHFSWLQPVYWSLTYEFVFYIVVGLCFRSLWPRHLAFTALVGLAAVLLKWAIMGGWDGRLPLFVLGVAAARYFLRKDGLATFLVAAALTVAAMVIMGSALSASAGLATALAIALLRLPSWRPLTLLGAISYSLYLTHVPIGGRIVNLGMRFGHGPFFEASLSILALIGSLLFAWLFHRIVEAAALRWSKRLLPRQPTVSPADVSTLAHGKS